MVARFVVLTAALTAAVTVGTPALAQTVTRVSVASNGGQANGASYFGNVTANARFVVFSSDATNLVPGDTNARTDVFRRDLKTGQTTRISVNDAGVQGDGRSFASGVSRDGRLVLFWSHATNLVAGDTNGFPDVFLRDVLLGTTTRLGMGLDGVEPDGGNRSPSMSDDGRWVAFQSWATNLVPEDRNDREDTFVLDRRTGGITRVGQPARGESDGDSLVPQLSRDGRYLAFDSSATNLVPGDTNGTIDAFMLDRTRGTLVRASVTDAGVEGNQQSRSPIVSDNGRWVLFLSAADNLVPGDTNQSFDSFIHDVRRRETRRVSVATSGAEGNHGSSRGTFDAKGRFVAFGSSSNNFVAGDDNVATDAFLRDLARGTTTLLTAAYDGGDANGHSQAIAIAGRMLLVSSTAANLVPGDDNGTDDLFLMRWR